MLSQLSRRTSAAWNYFTSPVKQSEQLATTRCSLCLTEKGEIVDLDCTKNTMNMRNHLKMIHKAHFTEMKKKEDDRSKDNSHQRMMKKLIDLIISVSLPFSIVEEPTFRSFVEECTGRIFNVSATHVRDEIVQRSSILQDKISDLLENVNFLALTSDKWSSCSTEAYLGTTLHYITEECSMESISLACDPFPGHHRAVHLAAKVMELLESYDLPESKIVAITMDNEPTCSSTANHLPFPWVGCIAHRINLVCNTVWQDQECLYYPIGKKVSKIIGSIKHSDVLTHKLKLLQQKSGIEKRASLSVFQYVEARWWSYHSALERLLKLKPFIVEMMDTGDISDRLSEEEWAAMQFMAEIFARFALCQKLLEGEQYVTVSLVPRALYSMKDIISVIQIFSSFPPGTSQNVFKIVKSMGQCMQKTFVLWFGSLRTPKVAFEEHFYLGPRNRRKGIQPLHWMASALDIRTKSLRELILKDEIGNVIEDERIRVWQLITAKYQEMHPTSSTTTTSSSWIPLSQSSSSTSTSNSNLFQQPFNLFRTAAPPASIEAELESFKGIPQIDDENMNPLEWWKHNKKIFPKLWSVAKAVFTVQATSASSERVFSTAGNEITDKRNRLNPETAEHLILLNSNFVLYQKLLSN